MQYHFLNCLLKYSNYPEHMLSSGKFCFAKNVASIEEVFATSIYVIFTSFLLKVLNISKLQKTHMDKKEKKKKFEK